MLPDLSAKPPRKAQLSLVSITDTYCARCVLTLNPQKIGLNCTSTTTCMDFLNLCAQIRPLYVYEVKHKLEREQLNSAFVSQPHLIVAFCFPLRQPPLPSSPPSPNNCAVSGRAQQRRHTHTHPSTYKSFRMLSTLCIWPEVDQHKGASRQSCALASKLTVLLMVVVVVWLVLHAQSVPCCRRLPALFLAHQIPWVSSEGGEVGPSRRGELKVRHNGVGLRWSFVSCFSPMQPSVACAARGMLGCRGGMVGAM